MEESAFLMRVPVEVRLMIYGYLFRDGGNERLSIRNASAGKFPKTNRRRRTRYYTCDPCFPRRYYETTYRLVTEAAEFCTALMCVSHRIHDETSYLLYGKHSFDFGADIEAVGPFLSDIRPASRALIQEFSLYKRGPIPFYESDGTEWRKVCQVLQQRSAIKKLRLVVQGASPSVPWGEGPREFSASDFKLLSGIKYESLDWTTELAQVQKIKELEILSDIGYRVPLRSRSLIFFAAFSASIEKGLAEFLRQQLQLPELS